jgi:hypothetical protein
MTACRLLTLRKSWPMSPLGQSALCAAAIRSRAAADARSGSLWAIPVRSTRSGATRSTRCRIGGPSTDGEAVLGMLRKYRPFFIETRSGSRVRAL